ncbi:MAG TPA: carbohydrate ABC transporter permease [Clostridiales bacterium]|nr:carbohydrate ABC transporter permease [Clostridiales bacterium]
MVKVSKEINRKNRSGSIIRETTGDKVLLAFAYCFLWFALIITLYPLIYVVSASISDPVYVNSGQMWLIPKGITFEGYKRLLDNNEIWIGYRNTIIYTIGGTLVSLFITLTCGYALSKKVLPGKGAFMVYLLITMFFSGGLIPSFIWIKRFNMLDTIWAVIIPGAASVWNIIITRTYIQTSIPAELEEAAVIDGCSTFHTFLRIILPLSAPIIAVMALFAGVGRWNSYFQEMIYLTSRTKFPLQVFLREQLIVAQMMQNASKDGVISGEAAITMAEQAKIADIIKYAIMIVATLPIIIVYPLLQRFFVKGIMIGSVKG